ncbi:hypothetical protein C6503_01125 [Candidatus Poribacteria bacterium]|nr:MAG: hypothetical protein C6503_01125 [Candidatus Poribacteria bacterium]
MKTFNNKIALNLDGDAEVSVKGFIAPIEYTQRNYHVDWDELANLKPAEPEKQYPASVFQAFLPSAPVSVGECWQIEEEGALKLLRQLSLNPQLGLDVAGADSFGLWACLRAYNDAFAEILFRIHAEFVLEKGYFAPSQFAGHVVIDQNEKKVAAFKMHVPEATLNFDARWRIFGDKRLAADIGFCPQMELCAGVQDVLQDAKFTEAITQAEALHALMLRFYKSAQINWVSLEEALELAPTLQKPIHAISSGGPLADESC